MKEQFLWIRHFINIILMLAPHSRVFAFRRMMLSIGGVNLEKTVKFCGGGWVYGRGNLHIKEGTWLSPKTVFYTNSEARIEIGKNCDIGPGVKFMTGSHKTGLPSRRAGKGIAGKITIGDGVWIGGYSVILGGVSIGDGCVIASGSVVIRDVPDNILVAGVPAIEKKKL
ncbi:MAG: transferase [Bacteroidetes bacterium]|nr:transferase [Bacteroidota bacterium]